MKEQKIKLATNQRSTDQSHYLVRGSTAPGWRDASEPDSVGRYNHIRCQKTDLVHFRRAEENSREWKRLLREGLTEGREQMVENKAEGLDPNGVLSHHQFKTGSEMSPTSLQLSQILTGQGFLKFIHEWRKEVGPSHFIPQKSGSNHQSKEEK